VKTLKEFLLNKQKNLPELVEDFDISNEPEILELTEEPSYIVGTEKSTQRHNHPMDPPAVLIMRRKSIRQFPNNQRVALYFVDKINKYVTVPYEAMQWSSTGGGVAEETQIDESIDVIGQLQKIKNTHQQGTVKHKDGSASKVDEQTAHAVLTVHGALNAENKKKYADMVARSNHHLQEAAEFAWKHLN
jgi:hypothetical protein